jgi:hypothetical protein
VIDDVCVDEIEIGKCISKMWRKERGWELVKRMISE